MSREVSNTSKELTKEEHGQELLYLMENDLLDELDDGSVTAETNSVTWQSTQAEIEKAMIELIKRDLPEKWNQCLISEINPFDGERTCDDVEDVWLLDGYILDYQLEQYSQLTSLLSQLKLKSKKLNSVRDEVVVFYHETQWVFVYYRNTALSKLYRQYVLPFLTHVGIKKSNHYALVEKLKQKIQKIQIQEENLAKQKVSNPTAFDKGLEHLPLSHRFMIREDGMGCLYLGADQTTWEVWRYRPKPVYALHHSPEKLKVLLGDTYTHLAEAFALSKHAETLKHLVVGTVNGSGVSESLCIEPMVSALSQGHFPVLESLYIGMFEMVYAGDVLTLECGDVTELVEASPNIKELEVEGDFSLKRPLRLTELEILDIRLDDEYYDGETNYTKDMVLHNRETIENLLNSDLPNLKKVSIHVQYFSGFYFSFWHEFAIGERYHSIAKSQHTELQNNVAIWVEEMCEIMS